MLRQHVHRFWHKNNQGLLPPRFGVQSLFTFKFILKTFPMKTPEVGLYESLNLGQAESSHLTSCHLTSCQFTKLCFLLRRGDWGYELGECRSHQDGLWRGRAAFWQPWSKKGASPHPGQRPRWKQELVLTGLRAVGGWPDRLLRKKGWDRGPGPTGTVQHTYLQNQLLSISVLSSGVHHW